MNKGFLSVPWHLWALLSLALSVVWVFVGPHTQMPADSSPRFLVVRWGHALTWLLLAISFFLRGLAPTLGGLANGLAVAGGLVYALFIVMTFVAK